MYYELSADQVASILQALDDKSEDLYEESKRENYRDDWEPGELDAAKASYGSAYEALLKGGVATSPVQEAAVSVAETWGGMFGFHNFGTYSCSEAEAFAALARTIGRPEIAQGIIAEHARGDYEETDQHHAIWQALAPSERDS